MRGTACRETDSLTESGPCPRCDDQRSSSLDEPSRFVKTLAASVLSRVAAASILIPDVAETLLEALEIHRSHLTLLLPERPASRFVRD